jgi:hypothetical protein
MDGNVMEVDKLKDQKTMWDDSYSILQPMFRAMEDDFAMALGDQWSESEKKELAGKGRPTLVLNHLLKAVKTVAGQQKQSRSDIRAFPVESSDGAMSDVYSQALKWIFTNCGGNYYNSLAFENAITAGLGWNVIDLEYDKDPLNGDFAIRSENPFWVVFDPNMKNPDLSDCGHIQRIRFLSKTSAASYYPDFAKDIEKLGDMTASNILVQQPNSSSTKNLVYITETWRPLLRYRRDRNSTSLR